MNTFSSSLLGWRLVLVFACLLGAARMSWAANACVSNANGNWSAVATWTGCGSKVPQAGDSVTIKHVVTMDTDSNAIASLTLNSGTTLTTTGTTSRILYLAGNLVNNGTLTLTAGSSGILLQGASTWSGSGTTTLDYLDLVWNTVTLDTTSTMAIYLSDSEPFRNVTAFNNGSSPNSSATVYLNGTAQTYDDYNLKMPNLVISSGTTTVISSIFTVLGNLTVSSGATLATDLVTTVNLGGNLTLAGTLSSFIVGSTTWVFNGTSAQSISKAVSFRSLTLNNSNGLTLGGDLTLGDSTWGYLTLTAGKLTTGSYSVIVPRNCSGSILSARNAGSWINGNLQLTMSIWGATCIFDIGDTYNYAPVTFTYPWHLLPLGGTVTASTTSGDHADTTAGTSGISASNSVNRYWTLTAGSSATFYTYDATFQYCAVTGTADCTVNDVDSAATSSNFVVAEKSAGSWTIFSSPSAPATNSRKVSSLTAFGQFAIGETGAASSCGQPANTPAGLTLTCQCDSFGRSSLNPSPMFTSSNWIVSTSDGTGIVPYINASTGFLRLTENTGNNAKAATVPGFFPAAGNYISVEFKHYAYNGSGADGLGIALSDYTVAPVPGASGGSLGYAQKTGVNGFAGGWIGVGVDEFGNFSNPTEGRVLGPGFIVDGVAVRGSGSGTSGYPYLGGTSGSLSPGVDNAGSGTPAYGHYYQIIVDARNSSAGQTWVAVNRDTSGLGTSYSSVVSSFDAYARAAAAGYTQAAVPGNWQLSFASSTGGSTNIHELGKVRICAQYYVPPDGGTAGGFSAIDEAYTSNAVQNFLTGHIYMKLVNTAFKLKLAALSNSQVLTTYAASATKNVTLKLVDNSDGLCGTDSGRASACGTSACSGKSAVSGGSQTLAFNSADKGIKTSADFTLDRAYNNLVAVITDGATTACSVDSFSVRPTRISSVTSSATNAGLTGTPKFKAGTDTFTLTATINAGNYTGTPRIDTGAMSVNPSGGVVGAFSTTDFPAATAGSSSSTAVGSFTYGEVGNFRFLGYDPASDTTSVRGILDDTWSAVDSSPTKGDCIAGSYANAKSSDGKYGCLFGLFDSGSATPSSVFFGRFVPARFVYLGGGLSSYCSAGTPFYMGQPALGIAYRLQAQNGAGAVTTNYSTALLGASSVATPVLVAEDQDAANQGCDLASRISGMPSAQWVSGVYLMNDADLNSVPDSATAVFSRPTAPVALNSGSCAATRASAGGPFLLLDVGVSLTDSDAGATLLANDMDAGSTGTCTTCTARKIGSLGMVYGRLLLNNAYGSEMLPVRVPVQAQYWSAAGWRKNAADSCSVITLPTSANGGLLFYPASVRNALAAGEVIAQINGSTAATGQLGSGDGRLVLRGPGSSAVGPGTGNFGYVDVVGSILTPSSTWLPASGNARVCFGACGPRSPLIYMREAY